MCSVYKPTETERVTLIRLLLVGPDMHVETTEDRGDNADVPAAQLVLTVYDFDASAHETVTETFERHGLDPSESGQFEVVEDEEPTGCFRTAPFEGEGDLLRRLQEDLVFALAEEKPAHRILDDTFTRPGDRGTRVYSVTAL